MKLIKVEDTYKMIENENSEMADTYSVRELTNILALSLVGDVKEYRKGNQELEKQIKLETNVLNALAKVVEVLN